MPKFTFYGTKSDITTDSLQQLRSVQPTVQAIEYSALSVRSADAKAETIETADDDLVVMQLSNDVEWHYRADEFEQFLQKQPGVKRGATDGVLEVPFSFATQESTRGAAELIKTKGLKIITGMVAKGAAQLLVDRMESGIDTGLHGLNAKFEFIAFDKKKVVKDKPYLLFIHGTNSDTKGAFSELMSNDAYKKLFKFYDGRILAFEHKTLSESPIKNVTGLLTALPDEMIMDVVSHSRGGIVADLLARCSNGESPFSANELKIINSNAAFANLMEEAKTANDAAAGKNLTIGKLVRVACPAAGTVLIDSRLDIVVNVFFNLLKLIPGAAACMPFTLFLDFVKAVVHERTEIDVFPGLAAQIPGSPLIRMLNNPNRVIKSELFVISGDVEHSGIWNSMLVMTTNLYFGEAHDLVVNSNSMFKGTYRETIVKEHFEQESAVNHFNYFKNKKSQDALLAALTEPQKVETHYKLLGASHQIKMVHQRGVSGKKPALFILPGIMGSLLEDVKKQDRLWVNFLGIASGRLTGLHVDTADIKATELHQQTYMPLVNYLSTDFDTYPFPYDWRMDLTDAANELAKKVNAVLDDKKRTNHDVHFIAHSMGGLVLRAMIHHHADLWKKLTSSGKTKVLMMGVPNEGSFATIRILLGKDSIIKKLALLDFINSKEDLLQVFKDYPGLAQLLPKNSKGIFEESTWEMIKDGNNEFTAIPAKQALKKAADFHKAIEGTDFDNTVFRYIAGQDDLTPENYFVNKGKIEFTGTAQGDGRVPWSTIPASLQAENIYYVQADHGGIPKFEKAFEGYKELLLKGKTEMAALSRMKPAARGIGIVQVMADSDFVSIPTEAELNENILGGKEPEKKKTGPEPISLSVINGDLVHSRHPVVVGHFKGDGIIYAEKYLDRALDYKLSEYHHVNNYPGDIGTHLVILDNQKGVNVNMICKGGVIVGLGEFGSLTENRLLLSLKQALLTLAIKYNELLKTADNPDDEKTEFGISSLLVGSDFAGLRISTSIKTILLAVLQVNEKLDAMSNMEGVSLSYKKINHVELVEIYQHKAIQIGRVIHDFLKQDGFSDFRFVPPVISMGSGALKTIPNENLQDNWHRLEVSVDRQNDQGNKADAAGGLPIRFTAITDKAHADQELVPANRLIVGALISKMSTHREWNKVFSQTLYELLIPNGFKGYGANLRNMVLIVDEETARYPWELLQDANGISEKPMVINTGIVRQLKSGHHRENVAMNNSNRALVIGDPFTEDEYPQLPGARKEAEKVLDTFRMNGLEVTHSIGEQDIEIVQKLIPVSYKIIHIASHGIAGNTAVEPTGVIFGKELIFTAADFDRIRVVPEFVFLNCCSSNEYKPEVAEQMRRKYDLAASVGTQLIQMGVKAAIVTGWEIDDEGAAAFSHTFYHAMFSGQTFGDAVRAAREKVYNEHGKSNTWGAYQCYGDPFYTFKMGSGKSKAWKPVFVSAQEVIYELDNFISELASSSKRKTAEESEERINAIIDAMQPEWKLDGKILERLADLYKTLSLFDKALYYYDQLFNLENASYSVKAVEQCCNIKTRFAAKKFEAGIITYEDATKIIDKAIESLKGLTGNSLERLSLIASCYRKRFDLDKKDFNSLTDAAEYYKKAFEHGQTVLGFLDDYPYFNWLQLSILLAAETNNKEFLKIPENHEELSAKALEFADATNQKKPDFFRKNAKTSYHLTALLCAEDKDAVVNNKKKILENFKDAWKREGKASDKDSFVTNLNFIISVLDQVTIPVANKKMKDLKMGALRDIIAEVSK